MFTICLQLTGDARCETVEVRDYDPELDDVRSVLADACEALQSSGAEFVVEGFGQRWPVDVSTDLLVVLEQLPRAVDSLKKRESAQIDFYEQGIERTLKIAVEGTKARLTCVSGTKWQPVPSEELMSLENLTEELETLKANFCRLSSQVCPSLASHPWMRDWCTGP